MSKQKLSREKAAEQIIAILDSKFFKTLSEPIRIELLKYLVLNGRSDIAQIASNFPQDRSVISRHLNLMSEVEILKSEKIARHVFYEVNIRDFLAKMEGMVQGVKMCIAKCCPEMCCNKNEN